MAFTTSPTWSIPELPVSAGAIILDGRGRLLVLKPTYKKGWTIPGGIMEADGESPWDACRREVLEETGLRVTNGRLACVDTRPGKNGRKLGLRFLFHCGTVNDEEVRGIRIQREEASEYRFVTPDTAMELLRKPVRRRVREALASPVCVYLENGRPIESVTSG